MHTLLIYQKFVTKNQVKASGGIFVKIQPANENAETLHNYLPLNHVFDNINGILKAQFIMQLYSLLFSIYAHI